jgi:hypothetical protein
VMVNGRVVLRHGRSTRVDEAEIFAAARSSTLRVAARLGVAPASPWLAAAGGSPDPLRRQPGAQA